MTEGLSGGLYGCIGSKLQGVKHGTPVDLTAADIVRIVQGYYDAVDSLDADRLAGLYHPGPDTTLQFNADDPIVTAAAIRAFSNGFVRSLAGIHHTRIEIWTTPLMGDVVPVDLAPERAATTITVVSTALPTFSIAEGGDVTRIALPATSIFTIDIPTQTFVSVHNMFDIGKVMAAVKG